jgi:hypothetical protein
MLNILEVEGETRVASFRVTAEPKRESARMR